MNKELARELMIYGRTLMARVAGGEASQEPTWVRPFLDLLEPNRPDEVFQEPLQSIFTLIDLDGQTTKPKYLRPVSLALGVSTDTAAEWQLMPVDRATAASMDRRALYDQFLQNGGATEQNFDRFFYLMRKYASTLPNTYGEPGVSLFEQWKVVAALVQISGSVTDTPQKLGLVSGDIPGIQRTISMVTSKGAAKAMRGRSAFIQLLGYALVQRLLNELELGLANVVYDAGGNFVLLTGWNDDKPSQVEKTVQQVANAVNDVLLAGTGQGSDRFDGFHGDLAVALGAVELPLEVLRVDLPLIELPNGNKVSRWQIVEKEVKDAVARAKVRPFGDLALASDGGWNKLFAPEPAETVDFCAVCRRQRGKDEKWESLTSEEAAAGAPGGSNLICPECWGFNQLANDLGHGGSRLLLSTRPPDKPVAWQRALSAVTNWWWYSIGKEVRSGDVTLALNLDDFPALDLDGFHLLARTTPLTDTGAIKGNDQLAAGCKSELKRLGVLRMDVDGLGTLLVHGLPRRTLMQTAELSRAMERFFAGWLDHICHRLDQDKDLFYVLFAGGDDLFVIGPWDLMVPLAQAIRNDFARYTGGHEAIHLSAGIAVVGEKAPLYAAADESHAALEAAKGLDRDTPQAKNAITFLGRTYHWDAFASVDKLQGDITRLVRDKGMPSGLVTALQAIERRYRKDLDQGRGTHGSRETADGQVKQVYYGPWMWRQAYALARMIEAHKSAKDQLEALKQILLDGGIEDLGLAARWAQWLTRKES